MNRLLLLPILFLFVASLRAQENVGIGTTTPNDFAILHLESADQGLLVPRLTTAEATAMAMGATEEGLFIYNTDAGLFWYWDGAAWVPFPGGSGTGTDDQNLTGATLSGTTLTIDIEDGSSVSVDLNALQDGTGSDDQDLTGASLAGTVLTVDIEDGSSISVDLAALQDGTGTDEQTLSFDNATGQLSISNGNTVTIPLSSGGDNWGSQVVQSDATLSGDGTSANPLSVSGTLTDDQDLTSASLSGTTLTIDIENGDPVSVDLNALQDGTGSDDQDLTGASLSGSTLTIDIENGTSASVDLSALQDGTGTDDQQLQPLGFDAATNILTVALENGGTQTIDLSDLQDAGGSDDQNLTGASLAGTTLTVDIENGASASVDLGGLQDGTGSDDQNLTGASLAGTTLTVDIENGSSASVDLGGLQDGTGSDDQNLTGASLAGTTLTVDIENGSSASVDLSGLQDGTGTDDQQLQPLGFNTTTNVLTVALENGGSQAIDLSDLQDAGGSDDQNLTGASLSGSTLTIDIENGASANVDLGALDTDNQTLSYTAGTNQLSISGGNSVTIDDKWDLTGNAGTSTASNFIGTTDNTGLVFRTNNTENARFLNSGDFLINSTTHLGGGVAGDPLSSYITAATNNWAFNGINTSTQGGGVYAENTSTTTGFNSLEGICRYNGTTNTVSGIFGLAIENTGIGIGVRGNSNSDDGTGVQASFAGGTSLAAAGWALFSDGWAGGTTAWQNVSDARLKRDVSTLSGSLDKVLSLRGVTYSFKEDNPAGLNLSGRRIGFIAQEVETVLPEVVRDADVQASDGVTDGRTETPTDVSSIKTVSYSEMVPVLVEAIKEQQALIEALEERIRALEAGE